MSSVELLTRSLSEESRTAFAGRVVHQATSIREHLAAGDLDTDDFAIGLEVEVYGAARSGLPRLRSIDDTVLACDDRISKELGRHNAEINTSPVALRPGGFDAQSTAIRGGLEQARLAADDETDPVLDGLWTVPPVQGSDAYLSAHDRRNGHTIAANMRPDARYYAIDNEVLRRADGTIPLDVTGVRKTFPTILFESLATSIQPHIQVPETAAFPRYFNVAIRTLGPLLALSSNSPFLPADLYDCTRSPETLIEETSHELRIAVFEQSVNHSEHPKVKVPGDLRNTAELIDRVVDDDLYAPFLHEWTHEANDDTETTDQLFADRFPEFQHKRGTFWRWVRPVVVGDPVEDAGDDRSLRIEYRPLPTQPTVTDIVSLQALTAGLLVGLVAEAHPLTALPWEKARDSFYQAANDGLAADLSWVRADGIQTDDPATIFEEVFSYARTGLEQQRFDRDRIDELLEPIESRWEAQCTPSQWKKRRVRDRVRAEVPLEEAIEAMQREYVLRSRQTDSFAEWLS